jgi:nicotinamidase-related amidase
MNRREGTSEKEYDMETPVDVANIALDPAKTALLIQGCQNDVIGFGGVLESEGMAEHAVKQNMAGNLALLAEACREAGAPVIHIWFVAEKKAHPPTNSPLWEKVSGGNAMVRGTWGQQPHPDYAPKGEDYVVEKTRTGCFSNSGLDGLLRSLGTENLICTGVLTNYSVVMTVGDAQDLGYRAFAVADGACSKDDEWHEAALKYQMPWLGWTFETSADAAAAIKRGASLKSS